MPNVPLGNHGLQRKHPSPGLPGSPGRFDPEMRLREDVDFHARAMRHFGVYFLDRVGLQYRIGSLSLMHSPKTK
jgi:hypothetical protein